MKRKIKQICSLMLAMVLCFSFVTSVSATENNSADSSNRRLLNAESYTFEVTADGMELITRSSVSGYNQKAIVAGDQALVINCTGSGAGGMGMTIETSCSSGNYTLTYRGAAYEGIASSVSGTMSTNGHIEKHNLYQEDLGQYVMTFPLPSGVSSYFVKVWIYG